MSVLENKYPSQGTYLQINNFANWQYFFERGCYEVANKEEAQVVFKQDLVQQVAGILCDHADSDAFMALSGIHEVERDLKTNEFAKHIIDLIGGQHG